MPSHIFVINFIFYKKGDCIELRNRAVQAGVAELVVEAASAPNLSPQSHDTFVWALSNFFRPNPQGIPMETARKVLECLKIYLTDIDNRQVR